MALVSPGVEVTIVDQSQYLPAATNSVPFVLLATAQDKANPNGTGIAAATTAANANKLYLVTSQRDLVSLYGNPFFYTSADGTPIQGYELNEYGLLAAYSALGVTNQLYALRADIDLASLVGSAGRPTGNPANGTWWLDATTSTWGIYEWNAATQSFSLQNPLVVTDTDDLSGGFPKDSLGTIGSYAVVALQRTGAPTDGNNYSYFYKNSDNTWVGVGTYDWHSSIPTVTGTVSNPSLTVGNSFTITVGQGISLSTATITVQAGLTTAAAIALQINNLGWRNLKAKVLNNRLAIINADPNASFAPLTIGSGTGTILADLGIVAKSYYAAQVSYGNSANQPLWQTDQTYPRPSGSVWIKVGSSGNGLVPVVSSWNDLAAVWVPSNVSSGISDAAVIASLDSTGGQDIPAGTVYTQYDFFGALDYSPLYLWERLATGPTVVTGTNTDPNFTAGVYYSYVYVTVPGSNNYSSAYLLTLADNSDANDFVTAWAAAAIPFTTAEVTSEGSIQITHTEGGSIMVDDVSYSGVDNGLMTEAGFIVGTTTGVKLGAPSYKSFTVTQASTTGGGTGLQLTVVATDGSYLFDTVAAGGTGFAVGDTVTFSGADLGGSTPNNDLVIKVTAVSSGAVTKVIQSANSNSPADYYAVELSNWVEFEFEANEGAPVQSPANNTNWFYSVVDQVDIMINTTAGWKGYRNASYDSNGFPLPSGTNVTDPNGPLVSASAPLVNSEGDPLVYGDLWIDTSDLENYPVIYRWQQVDGVDQWVLIDNTDQVNPNGIVFADARWATNGTTNPANDPIPTIKSLLSSNYLDVDAPENALYPVGMLLFNTRRSGYNVKQYRVNYFNSNSFPDMSLPSEKDAWVSTSGLQSNGAPYMGRKAQRAIVVEAMRAALDTNTAIRDEDNFFNLLATPNYPELQPNMVVLNSDRGETGYILGDTPMRLPDQATAIQAWATNANNATSTGEDGLVTRNTYLGLFYPSGLAFDLSGNLVAVPASHMMLRTFLRNDQIAYPWLAAAGTRRGIIDNAANIGYLDADTGEFQVIKTRIGIRDVLYTNFINPLVFFTGNGLLNYGNKTSFNSQSALDRTNVARLIAYIRRQLTIAGRPFVFEPNDAITREQISGVVESLMVDLVAKRGIYDYLVVCDESNNTPARIDRNELWIDVAIEPVKAAEFIYIPVRILNTGELAGA